MKLTYYGHSCFSVLVAGKHILFDPFIKSNELARSIQFSEIRADYIFVSHAHFDHMSDVHDLTMQTGAMVVAGWELYLYFQKNGFKKILPLNPGGQFGFDFGTVKCVVAQHSSSLPDGGYGGVATGFVLKTTVGNFYYSGDTALFLDMKLINEWAELDFAVLPIGDVLTMGVDDAIRAATWVNVEKVVGVHYDTFEVIKIDHEKAKETFKKAGMELYLPEIGCTVDL